MPFFILEIFLNDRNNFSVNKTFNKALNNYKKIDKSSRVFFELNNSKNDEKIFLLSGGKKKKISEHALEGYIRVLNLDMDYSIYDLYKYDNIYFRIAMYLKKIKLMDLSNYFNEVGIKKVYEEIIKNDTDSLFTSTEI